MFRDRGLIMLMIIAHCNLFSRTARSVITSVSETVEHLGVPRSADHQVAQRSLGNVARVAKPERES